MKDNTALKLTIWVIVIIILTLLANYCDQQYPPTRYVQGHEYILIGQGHSSTWIHSENCSCKK